MYYIGFLKKNANCAFVFKSYIKPKSGTHHWFKKILGPYPTETEANTLLSNLKSVGWRDNPVAETNMMSASKAMKLTRKVISHARDLYSTYKENPGRVYHEREFRLFMKDLEKYKIGSPPYIQALARAFEHLKSITKLDREDRAGRMGVRG